MKLKQVSVALGALALAGGVWAADAYTVHKVMGTALVVGQDGVTQPAKPGTVLVDGQVLSTGANSSLLITLKAGCTITIQPNTTFVVNSSRPCNESIALAGSTRLAQFGGPPPSGLFIGGVGGAGGLGVLPGLGGIVGIGVADNAINKIEKKPASLR